jgi:hypothetical protein
VKMVMKSNQGLSTRLQAALEALSIRGSSILSFMWKVQSFVYGVQVPAFVSSGPTFCNNPLP